MKNLILGNTGRGLLGWEITKIRINCRGHSHLCVFLNKYARIIKFIKEVDTFVEALAEWVLQWPSSRKIPLHPYYAPTRHEKTPHPLISRRTFVPSFFGRK